MINLLNCTLPLIGNAMNNQDIFANMDCLEGMKYLEDKSIDMVLADLPFGITQSEYDKTIPFEPMWEQILRIAKDNAAIVLMGCQPFTSDLIQSKRNLFRYELIWQMRHPKNFLNARKMPLRAHIDIAVFYKKLPIYNPQKTNGHPPVHKYRKHTSDGSNYGGTKLISGGGQTDRFPTTIIDIPYTAVNAKERIHSQQKPVELFEWLIKTYTDIDQTVCDITAGSGVTGIACLNTNRHYILYEKNPEIYQRSLHRLRIAEMQLSGKANTDLKIS
jgi:site-specific DNA-methyltransferase (adenine-specific)